tara:strand:+ start:61 stop:1146 length:1086 start_codon:yes stop_codon:yes gene_type:complete
MSKEIVWHKLCDILLDLRWVAKKNESELTLYLKNGSMITLKGSDNRDSLRGRAIDFLVLDEAAQIHPSVFFEVLRPALSDRNGHALFAGTPMGLGNFLKDLYDNALVDDNWESFHATTFEGGFVTEEEIEEAKHILDSRTFAQEMLADFIESGQKIFYNFDLDESVKQYPYGDDIPNRVYIGEDFNVGFLTAVVFDVHPDGTMWAFDEIVLTSANTDEMVQEIKNRYPNREIVCFPDPSAKANKTSAGGRTDISILQNAGFTVKAPNSHNPVRDTINAVNSMLKNAGGVRRMFVDPKCTQTIKSMDRWQYKEGTMIPEKDGAVDHSHLCDCVRYITDYLNPIRKQFDPQPFSRWGHKIGAY